ncbi:MAG: YceI family protein [Algicola sp.]|nr:YceI family protein [Algicola sp.]
MKRFLSLFLVFALLSFTLINETKTTVLLSSESKLYVEGTTNISDFNCKFDINALKGKIPVTFVKHSNNLTFKQAKLTLNNNCFDCGSKGINNDFNKLLKTENYPQIVLTLNELKQNPAAGNVAEAKLQIDMAGITKPYNIPVNINKENGFRVKGQLDLKISDFKLEPPKKVFGLIKVKDVITIHFDLVLNRC